MDTLKKQRQQLAEAILELHDLYISTDEEKKPMTISLPDIAEMAELSLNRGLWHTEHQLQIELESIH
jgi:hypothetical protein